MIRQPGFPVGLEVRVASDRDGRGLFVTEPVSRGGTVLEFGGPLLDREGMLSLVDRHHYLQIGPHVYLGPSGDHDDYANHSCAPSTRVVIDTLAPAASLMARHDLIAGDEVTFDYSSVQLEDTESVIDPCRCGAEICRGAVRDFSLMSRREQELLVRAGLCAWYLVEVFEGSRGPSG